MILLDASAIIFLMEGTADTQAAVRTALHESFSEPPPPLAVSALSRLECRVRPLRDDNQALLEQYDAFFNAPGLQTIALDALVIDKATELRARHRLRTPDALQAASLLTHAPHGTLITGDGDFLKVPGLHVRHVITPRP